VLPERRAAAAVNLLLCAAAGGVDPRAPAEALSAEPNKPRKVGSEAGELSADDKAHAGILHHC
jgi:hypothetical protein